MEADAGKLLRRGIGLEYATLAWNVVGSVVTLLAAVAAKSVALAAFGLDSLIEIAASAVVVWHLRGIGAGRERRALTVIGVAFLAVAVYVSAQAIYTLVSQSQPGESKIGIAWLGLTIVAMSFLAAGKARIGARLGNVVLQTEARVTLVDAFLAANVFVGLVLNALTGWSWADPAAALGVCAYAGWEGAVTLRSARTAGR